MKIHKLKIDPNYIKSIEENIKTFEIRKNDRNFKVGDALHLQEYCRTTKMYTGKETLVKVIYILHGGKFGLEEDYVCMAIREFYMKELLP